MTSPVRCPNFDGPPVSLSFQNAHCDSSLRRFSCLQICSPRVCSLLVGGKRSWENGFRISAGQRRESMLVLTSHRGAVDGSPPPPSPLASLITPEGLT